METVLALLFLLGLCFLVGLPFWVFVIRKRKSQPQPSKVKQLSDYPIDKGADTELPFKEWCRRNRKSLNKRRTNRDLWNYCYETGRPTFEDWKEIHGFERTKWVEDRGVYENWLKYIGAYNSKFDPSSPDYDGGDPNFEQKD